MLPLYILDSTFPWKYSLQKSDWTSGMKTEDAFILQGWEGLLIIPRMAFFPVYFVKASTYLLHSDSEPTGIIRFLFIAFKEEKIELVFSRVVKLS